MQGFRPNLPGSTLIHGFRVYMDQPAF